ncbi:MAG: winged helix-turn-helix domain-containing protein [Candidatus Uhrbacteria bacterium]|nr:winged helix-turn-helix domain-containing protein [Candidatus Uhrbacteria bacterium]
MEQLEKILKAFASQRRLSLLRILKMNPCIFVDDIAREIGLSYRSTSKHLRILYDAGIIDRWQNGFGVVYSVRGTQNPVSTMLLSII